MTGVPTVPAEARGRCRSCHAHILWCVTADGERMPVDAKPAGNGNVLLMVQSGRLMAGVYGPKDAKRRRNTGAVLYLSHFVTCPKADHHRKKGTTR